MKTERQQLTELRKKTAEQLNEALLKARRKQFDLRMQHATGQAARPHEIKAARREIARIKTILVEKTRAN